jgi:NTE family protein
MRRTLTDHPPDVLVMIPRSSCRTLDFHKAEVMIELGRRLTVEALDRREGRSAPYAVGSRPQLSAS